MTYPRVAIRGENLPRPFDGWGDEEYSNGETAVYLPTRFKWAEDQPLLYLVWESDDAIERMWVHADQIDSVKVTHDD